MRAALAISGALAAVAMVVALATGEAGAACALCAKDAPDCNDCEVLGDEGIGWDAVVDPGGDPVTYQMSIDGGATVCLTTPETSVVWDQTNNCRKRHRGEPICVRAADDKGNTSDWNCKELILPVVELRSVPCGPLPGVCEVKEPRRRLLTGFRRCAGG